MYIESYFTPNYAKNQLLCSNLSLLYQLTIFKRKKHNFPNFLLISSVKADCYFKKPNLATLRMHQILQGN